MGSRRGCGLDLTHYGRSIFRCRSHQIHRTGSCAGPGFVLSVFQTGEQILLVAPKSLFRGKQCG